MVVIGPGSEWFWAAAQFVVITVTLLGLYRQLRAQNAANVLQRMDLLQGEWQTRRMIHARLAVAVWLRDHPGEAPDYGAQAALGWLCDYFENLSDLEEDGYLTWKEIENTWGQVLVIYWGLLEPVVQSERARTSVAYGGFERLAKRAHAGATERGDRWSVAEVGRDEVLASQIGRNAARLAVLNAIEAGDIPGTPVRPGSVRKTAARRLGAAVLAARSEAG